MRWRVLAVGVVTLALTGCLPWQTYTSTEAAYQVDMPGKPQLRSHTVQRKFDKKEYKTYTLNTAVVSLPQGAFLSAWADLPVGIELDLPTQVQEIAAQYKAQVSHEEAAPQLAGVPGIAFRLNTTRPAGEGAGRLWQFQNRLYVLLVLGPRVDPHSGEVERFFNSFKLTNPLMQPSS
jgi:hypothetical protein